MGYLKIAGVFAFAWVIALQVGFTNGQAWLLSFLATALTLLFLGLSEYSPRPYVIWITPKWEAIQGAYRIASDAQFRSWLDRAYEIESRTPGVDSIPTERELVEANVTLHGVGIQCLHQNLFRVSDFETFASALDWQFFLEISSKLPDGSSVTVLVREQDETFELDATAEAELLASLAEADRGELIPASRVLRASRSER